MWGAFPGSFTWKCCWESRALSWALSPLLQIRPVFSSQKIQHGVCIALTCVQDWGVGGKLTFVQINHGFGPAFLTFFFPPASVLFLKTLCDVCWTSAGIHHWGADLQEDGVWVQSSSPLSTSFSWAHCQTLHCLLSPSWLPSLHSFGSKDTGWAQQPIPWLDLWLNFNSY